MKDFLLKEPCDSSFFLKDLLFEESGESDFGTVYMILIFAIAALLLVLIVKPLFQSSMKKIGRAHV